MKKTPEASVWMQLWSNQAHMLSVVVFLQMVLPFWQGVIPPAIFGIAGALINTAGLYLRGIEQPKVKAKLDAKISKPETT
tara:strand:- start:962 stop:1201 length:240 start_codon:yes stop_codon:yes gene_type:complete